MISRWEKAAKKMVKIGQCPMNTPTPWVVSYPSCLSHDGLAHSYFDKRENARKAAQLRVIMLTKILRWASKAAGF